MYLFYIICLICAVGTASAPVPKGRSPSHYYPTQIGTHWTLDSGKSKYRAAISKREVKDGAILVTSRFVEDPLTPWPCETVLLSDQGLFLIERSGIEFHPPLCVLQFPLEADREWTTKTKANESTLVIHHKMGREEWIEVPSGRFKAIPVTQQVITPDGPSMKPTISWYSPGLGCIKRQSGDWIEVMRSFSPATP